MTIDDRLNQAANSLEDDETGPPPFSEVRHRAARRRAVFGVAGALLLVLSGLGAFAATNDGRRIRISASQVADGANTPTTYATTPPTTTASTPTSVRTTTTSIVPIVTAAAPPSTEALPPVTTEPVTTIPETTVPETTVPQTIETTMVTTPPTAAPTTEPVFAGCFMTEPGCANVAYEPDPQPNQPITLVGGATPRVEEHPYGAPTTFSPSWYIDVEFTLTEPDTTSSSMNLTPAASAFFCRAMAWSGRRIWCCTSARANPASTVGSTAWVGSGAAAIIVLVDGVSLVW